MCQVGPTSRGQYREKPSWDEEPHYASATGNPQLNARLSRERSQALEPIIDQYLVNVPYRFFKAYELGDIYSSKSAGVADATCWQAA